MKRTMLLCLLLAGCATNPPVNNVIAATAESILALSIEADRAEMRGWIDGDTETAIQVRLLDAVDLLDITIDTTECDPPLTRNECVQEILLEVEQQLREAQP